MTDFISGTQKESSSVQFREKAESRSLNPGEPATGVVLPLDELTHIKHGLSRIKGYARLAEERSVDKRFGEHFRRSLTQEVDKIDTLLERYIASLRIKTPSEKRDTVHKLIDETLGRYQGLLEEKRIRLIRKFEPGLPEPIVPDEPLRIILNSLLWYALTWIPPVTTVGFFTKTRPLHVVTTGQDGILHRKERHDLEILFVLSGRREPLEFSGTPAGVPLLKREGIPGLMLRLIEEIVSSHQGEWKVELDSKKAWVLFSLKFPVERRRKVSCGSSGNE